jgi:anti-sigma-K factor RskA
MKDDLGLFRELTPPPGGAERFRQRLEELERSDRPPQWRALAAAAACAAVVLAAIVLLRDRGDPAPSLPESELTAALYNAPEFDRLLGRQPPPVELAVTLNQQTASVVEIETTNEKVRIYQIN